MVADPIPDGAVVVDGGRVRAVGPATRLSAPLVREWPGVLMPGLVNAHAHLEYGPSFADLASVGPRFADWIAAMTERRRSHDPAAMFDDARESITALLRSGTTCVGDVVSDVAGIAAAAQARLPGVSYVEAVGIDARRWRSRRERLLDVLAQAPSGRSVGVSPHSLYTLGTSVFRSLLALARDRGLAVHTHLAESGAEVEYVRSGTGPFAAAMRRFGLDLELLDRGAGVSPVAHLDALGGLGPDVYVAHGVCVDARDRATLRRSGSAVALCPRSNRTLGVGEAPVAAYLAEGNPIAVGTDSLASAPDLELLADVRELAVLARAQGYAAGDLERRLVHAATLGGSGALARPDVGRLAEGVRADLAVFDVPIESDPYAALVAHGAGACVGTVVAGQVVFERAAA
jgi:cytosine/adenosine deaminase-related metal-dependent hydrolase